jgi:predicted NUDIX family NTP pyrophosphohydrolase
MWRSMRRGDERVTVLVEGPLHGEGDEEEAGAAVVVVVGVQDVGAAEMATHAAVVELYKWWSGQVSVVEAQLLPS